MSSNKSICETANIAAFIDGELEAHEHAAVAEHIESCSRCASDLQKQRQFICELDLAMTSPFDLPVPLNFSEVVAVRAESDMRGLRHFNEHRKALLFSVMLAVAAFGLLGAHSESVVRNAQALMRQVIEIIELFGKALYDAASGFALIVRVITAGLIPNSRAAGFTTLILFVLAFGLLSLLIARYHRTRIIE